MTQLSYSIFPLGDSALVIDFGNIIEENLNRKALAIAHAFQEAGIEGIKDVVPAYSSVTVHYDVTRVVKRTNTATAFETLKDKAETLLLKSTDHFARQIRKIKIPVCYAPKYALDLDDIAAQANIIAEEVVELHTSRTYKVYMVGFLPGFAYMGEVDERIALPRKSEPRQQITEGCVGIAGKQTGIYPLTSPGGWQIIGRTPVKLFDKDKTDPVLFAAGDEVEFFSISEDEFDNY